MDANFQLYLASLTSDIIRVAQTWTFSTKYIYLLKWDDQSGDAYSSSGLTNAVNISQHFRSCMRSINTLTSTWFTSLPFL